MSFRQALRMVREVDIQEVLPSIEVPALVIQRRDDKITPPVHGQCLVEHLPDARYVEQPGDHAFWLGPAEDFLDGVQRFVGGIASADRSSGVLTTLLVGEAIVRHLAAPDTDVRSIVSVPIIDRSCPRWVDAGPYRLLATFDGPARATECALALQEAAARDQVRLRVGLHVGETAKDRRPTAELHSTARAVAGIGDEGEVLVSGTVKDLMTAPGLEFSGRGSHPVGPADGPWDVYAVRRSSTAEPVVVGRVCSSNWVSEVAILPTGGARDRAGAAPIRRSLASSR